MGKFSVRFNSTTEDNASGIIGKGSLGNTKNAILTKLVNNYEGWMKEISDLKRMNRNLEFELSELKQLVNDKIMADKRLSEHVRKKA